MKLLGQLPPSQIVRALVVVSKVGFEAAFLVASFGEHP
jgi:hypothetical protein